MGFKNCKNSNNLIYKSAHSVKQEFQYCKIRNTMDFGSWDLSYDLESSGCIFLMYFNFCSINLGVILMVILLVFWIWIYFFKTFWSFTKYFANINVQ